MDDPLMDPKTARLGWGGASVDIELFQTIRRILPKGKTVLELGSGYTTGELAKYYTVYSVEHDERWLNLYPSTYIHAPLELHKQVYRHEGNTWYSPKVIRKNIRELEYDLLLVDGPPYERAGLIKYLDCFKTDVPMVFDDADRNRDMKVIITIARMLKKPYVVYTTHGNKKMYSVINYPGVV